jgi:hypothetical protein
MQDVYSAIRSSDLNVRKKTVDENGMAKEQTEEQDSHLDVSSN